MRIIIEVCAALLFGTLVLAVIGMDSESPKAGNFPKAIPDPDAVHKALGELRCEDHGAIVMKVDGTDYAVNGMASPRYPPIQALWTEHSHPEIDVDRLIVHGITLCAW